jgi:hypothetical protein
MMQALTISLAAALAGCSTGPVPNIVSGGDATLPAGEESPAFLDRVSSEARVNQNDAMRAVLMLMDDKDETTTFSQRVEKLLERKVVDPSWTFDASRPVTKGELAYMMYQALSLRGGVILMVTGPTQRYCLREMQYLGFISAGLMTTDISGGELVAVLARADNYKTTGRVPEIMKTSTAQ